jgi:pilus assembly protein CpaF
MSESHDPYVMHTLERISAVLARLEGRSNPDMANEILLNDRKVVAKTTDQLADLGPIMQLITDPSVTDILINGHKNVYVEVDGKMQKTNIEFANDEEVFKIGSNIAKTIGRQLSVNRPLVDARLLDGSRVNIIAPPLAVDGTSISIRKFSSQPITLDMMAAQKNLSKSIAEVLKVIGASRLNIVISGGTGAGKTTLLNAMGYSIHEDERLVTVEDAAELKLPQPNIVRLETKPFEVGRPHYEEVTIRDLVRNALRMRPNRIIVGEVRGVEAFDMLQAMNTGHEGSMTTIHANHPRDALSRLENMIMMADLGMPVKSVRYQIAAAVNIIVQISRMRDGHRRITHVCEVVGMEGDTITMQDLFVFQPDGTVDKDGKLVGKFKWTGIVPRFVRRAAYWGYQDQLAKALGIELPKV